VIFQLSFPTLLLANPRNVPRRKANISRLNLLFLRNPVDMKAVVVYHRTLKMRRETIHQEAKEGKNIVLIHPILILRWMLEKASISQSISIRKNTGQSLLLIQKLRFVKIQGGI